jgi:outer membrane biosynthesis protein TonB
MKFLASIPSELGSARFLSARTLCVSALCLAFVTAGCEKKVVRTSTPPVLVPSIESSPAPTPEPQPEPAAAIPTTPPTTPEPESQKPKTKPRKTIVRAPKPAEPAKPEPPKPEAAKPAEPPKPDNSVQITAAVPSSAVQSQTQNTEQLLRNSEGKLNGITRALSESEQSMAKQARNYIAQSRQAIQESEIERAYNLAVKANLLAEELAKPK